VHKRYRQTTGGRATAYSDGEREFTFAKMGVVFSGAGVKVIITATSY